MMENEVKNNKPLILVIVVLVAVLCTLLGIILGGKFSNKENTPNIPVDDKDNNNVVEQIPIVTKSEVEELTKNILDNSLYIIDSNSEIVPDFKLFVAYANTPMDNENVTCKSIFSNNSDAKMIESDWDGGMYTVNLSTDEKYRKGNCDNNTETKKYDKVNKEHRKLFGTDADKINLNYGTIQAYYDKNSNQYVSLDCHCGSGPLSTYTYDVESFDQTEKKLTVNVTYISKSSITSEKIGDGNLKLIFEYENNGFIFKDIEKN